MSSPKHQFYRSDEEFQIARVRYDEINQLLDKWPELKLAIENEDQEKYYSVLEGLSYTDYIMVVRLFKLSKEAERSMAVSFNEMSKTYRELVRTLELKLLFYDCVIIMDTPFVLVCTGILAGALALSIALDKKGSLLSFIDNWSLQVYVLAFAASALTAGIMLYVRKKSSLAKSIQKLKDYLASNPKLYEVYGECIASTEKKTANTIMKLMNEKPLN